MLRKPYFWGITDSPFPVYGKSGGQAPRSAHGFPLQTLLTCQQIRNPKTSFRGIRLPRTVVGSRGEVHNRAGSDDVPETQVVSTKPLSEVNIPKVTRSVILEDESGHSATTFAELELDDSVLDNLPALGITSPTPIQAAAVPIIMDQLDCAVQCFTGSGKTLAYLLPVLSMALQRRKGDLPTEDGATRPSDVQALIVAPSQELAVQILRVLRSLLPKEVHRTVQQCIGGANPKRQVEALKFNKPLVVVGTPGRLAEHSRNGVLQTHGCPLLVLDEVDQLVSQIFKKDMQRITQHTGCNTVHRQTVLVSATVTPAFVAKLSDWCPAADFVFVGSSMAVESSEHRERKPGEGRKQKRAASKRTNAAAEQVEAELRVQDVAPRWGWNQGTQWRDKDVISSVKRSKGETGLSEAALGMPPGLRHGFLITNRQRRVDAVRRLMAAMDLQHVLVFMNFQNRLQDTMFKLAARGMQVSSLHGGQSKVQRQQTVEAFRNGKVRALVVSDVAARGIDLPDCDGVLNLELPSDATHYTHRAGRTGRMGREGWVVSFVETKEQFVIHKLRKKLGVDIQELEVSGGEVHVKAPR